ncbi:UNVERIFIED_CONTAM: hypothetical protein FKN15_015514 [Acipenser sinensis]
MEAAHISPELPIRWVVSADRTVEIKEEVTELGCDQANERILQEETPPSSITERDPKESHSVPETEAQEGPRIEAVYTREESFDQEWCASQVTELTCVKGEEVPRLECVPIKEEFIEQECVPIAEEVPTENNVCTLEENNKLGSSRCDDCPPECELGFRVGVYTFLIAMMANLALVTSRPLTMAGALFFMTSDLTLACHTFVAPLPWGGAAVMTTYYLAQVLIAVGGVRE